jgi:hypothetical protein
MRALVLNCTLKPSPEKSNTDQLAEVVVEALRNAMLAETDDGGHEWSAKTGRAMAANLVAVARALEAAPIGPPPP